MEDVLSNALLWVTWQKVVTNVSKHMQPYYIWGSSMVADWQWLPVASQIWSRLGNYGRKRVNNNSPDYSAKGSITLFWHKYDNSSLSPSLSLLCLPPSLLLVSLVMMIRVILKRLVKDAFLRELAPDWKRISNDSILWLSPQSHYFANIMDQSSQLQPLLVRVNRSNPLGSLKAVHRVWHRRLDVRCVYVWVCV